MHPQRISPSSEGRPRSTTGGYAQIPNSIIENQSALSPAELALVLIVIRGGRDRQTVSDKLWKDWTGKTPKMKAHAIRGLKDKGLSVRGRGNTAKYHFDREHWDSWVRCRPLSERARTAGRSKSVTAKSGMQIHQECRDRGCQRMCEPGSASNEVIPFPATPNWKPVSETPPHPPPHPPPKTFHLTLAAVQKYFPHVDEQFIQKLVAAVSVKTKHFTDAQLAQVVHAAKKRNQESEGLFLLTVPARYASGVSTQAHLTEPQRRELRDAKEALADHPEWPEDALAHAREIVRRYGG
jgi:hypothetical protein